MLPEGWKLEQANDLCSQISVGIVVKPAAYYVDETCGVRAFRSANVGEGFVKDRDWVYISEEGHYINRKSVLRTDDVLIVRTGYPGTACLVPPEYEGSNCIDIIFARPAPNRIIPSYLCVFTNSEYGKKQVLDGQGGLAQQHFNVGAFKELKIPLPPIAEQRRIAEILSTWDLAIAVQEQLVANARAQKKALMQTLLTSKKRLPGFKGEWKTVRLGQLGEFRKGSGIQRDQVLEDGLPCIRYGEIYTTHHDQIREFASFIDSKSALEAERLVTGDLLFTCSGETAEEIGKCVAFLGSCEAYAGGDIILLNPNGHNSLFMSYVLNSADVVEQKRKFGQGHSVVHISAANLAKLSFKIPARSEQDAIATTIDSASDLIRGGEDDLAKMKLQKSALMQQLLTGKRRVKVEAIEQ
jgi:type I restriction enzyme, S subunit